MLVEDVVTSQHAEKPLEVLDIVVVAGKDAGEDLDSGEGVVGAALPEDVGDV